MAVTLVRLSPVYDTHHHTEGHYNPTQQVPQQFNIPTDTFVQLLATMVT